MKTRRTVRAVAGLATLALPMPLRAQTRSATRLIIGFPPGGSGDAFARIVASGLSAELRQPVVVDIRGNRIAVE
jgi:tripartite-type tricarboxylate transporter receptor subunit TctC